MPTLLAAATVAVVPTGGLLSLNVLLATLVYAAIGIVIFVVGFWLWDKATPADLWGEICRGNQAVAILAAGVAIGLALIINAAIHS
jgi:putative membrane protein